MMRILAATDGSEAAMRAVEFAARLACGVGGELKIVNAVSVPEPPRELLAALSRQGRMSVEAVLGEQSEETLKIARQRASDLGVPGARSESRTGDAATTIIDLARLDHADVIVLGKRGLGRLSGLFLGSVSQKVVSHALCTVIVVP
jgi:nucleotide-binding universal stress UspA family protein